LQYFSFIIVHAINKHTFYIQKLKLIASVISEKSANLKNIFVVKRR